MTDPTVVSRMALDGMRVAISASESADLGRLGLSEFHCRLVIAEVARGLMLAGATVLYGGNITASGYSSILIDEVQRHGGYRRVLELVVPESEYSKHTTEKLEEIDARLSEAGTLRLVDASGSQVEARNVLARPMRKAKREASLTAMRRYIAQNSDASVLIGGKLSNYQGREPGVIEEARLCLEEGNVLLAAGGFGGAAAAVSNALEPGPREWQPSDYPEGAVETAVMEAIDRLVEASDGKFDSGSHAEHRRVLATSHRPADIAWSVVSLLSAQGV